MEVTHPHEIVLDEDGKCINCHRPLPKQRADSDKGQAKSRITFTVPIGEEGVLEELLVDLVDKYKEVWPDVLPVGDDQWKWRAVHFAVYSCLIHDIVPSEEGG